MGEWCRWISRADYLVARNVERYVAEVKTGRLAPRIDTATTRRQLLEYRLAFDVDGVLLVDAESAKVHRIVFPLPRAQSAGDSLTTRILWLAIGLVIGSGAMLRLCAGRRCVWPTQPTVSWDGALVIGLAIVRVRKMTAYDAFLLVLSVAPFACASRTPVATTAPPADDTAAATITSTVPAPSISASPAPPSSPTSSATSAPSPVLSMESTGAPAPSSPQAISEEGPVPPQARANERIYISSSLEPKLSS